MGKTAAVIGRIVLLAGATAATLLARAALGVPTAIGARADALRTARDADRAAPPGANAAEPAATASRGANTAPPAATAPRDANTAPPAATAPRGADGLFRNAEPGTTGSGPGPILRSLLARGATGRPSRPVPLAAVEIPPMPSALAVTWFGHSSVLIEIDGRRLLADPVWGERVSPSRLIGPRRMHPVPIPLTGLPSIDAVLISHDHYDHLDLPTVLSLIRDSTAPFVVPLGIGAHLRRWGLRPDRITELDWNGSADIAGLHLTCTQARHFSGRGRIRNTTLWSSWAVSGPQHRAFFGGDTGYTGAFADIGARLGPFDLVALPIGAYSHHWPDVHMTPEQTARAHLNLRGDMLLPVHWATFNLGFHRWGEPIERLCTAAEQAGVRLAVPRPGEWTNLASTVDVQDWWTQVG